MENVKKVFNKILDKKVYKIPKIILIIFCCVMLSVILEKFCLEKFLYNFFSIDRVCIISIVLSLIFTYIFVDVKDKLEYIYKYRFLIVLAIFLIFVMLGYSGSSINVFNDAIQSEITNKDYEEVLGVSRVIRSDEWAVNTPLVFSQNTDINKERLTYFSDNLRGTNTDMFTVINAPVLDIVSIGKIFNIGYLFGNKTGLSFWWYGRLFALILISFELIMLISKGNKKVSLLGMLLITLSPAVQWWYSNFIADILIWGSLAIILIDKFMLTSKLYVKILSAIGIGISIISYIFTFYPAWIISFFYVYLALFIWVVLKNIKYYKINIKDVIIIFLIIIFVASIGIRYYMLSKDTLEINLNTSYPGERFILGGEENGKVNIFSYVYSMLFPVKSTENPCEMSSMYSLFPLPILMAILLMFKDKENRKENLKLIIPLLVSTIILTIWVFIVTNNLFAKITFLYMVPCNRCIIPLGFAQIILLLFVISRIDKENIKLMSKEAALILSLVLVPIIYIYMYIKFSNLFTNYITLKFLIILIPINILVFYLTLSYNNERKYNKYFYLVVGFIVTFSGILVNPIIKGVDVIYEKPVSKKVQEILNDDPSALWLSDGFIPSNYLVANGAKVISSTNYYPNFEMLKLVLEDKYEQNREIYNRYAHISIELTNDESNVELITLDSIKLYINLEDLKVMNVKYILTSKEIDKTFDLDVFEKIYDKYGMRIYKINNL